MRRQKKSITKPISADSKSTRVHIKFFWGNVETTVEFMTTPGWRGSGTKKNKIRIVHYSQIIYFTLRLYIIL